MIYREMGQFKTSYGPTSRSFRSPGPYLVLAIIARRLRRRSFIADEYLFRAILILFLIPSLAALESTSWSATAADVAGRWRFHGDRRPCRLQFRSSAFRTCVASACCVPGGDGRPLPWASCSDSQPAHQAASISQWRRWPRSSSPTGPSCASLVHQRLVVRRDVGVQLTGLEPAG